MRKIQPAVRAFLQITFQIQPPQREEAITRSYLPHQQRFLDRSEGGVSMDWLARAEDVQLLLGFDTVEHAQAFQKSPAGRELVAAFSSYANTKPQSALYTVD
ncbi:MAG: hypothetical protein IH614_14640 [Desulfuromonadales bacterium]|nr:hypothetical protein [Desulfuromonadales bacterium]